MTLRELINSVDYNSLKINIVCRYELFAHFIFMCHLAHLEPKM